MNHQTSKDDPILIAAPAYDHRSAGIRVLHTLCNELNLCNRAAYLVFYKFSPLGGADFFLSDIDEHYSPEHKAIKRLSGTTDIEELRQLAAKSIVIYPEVLQGNPLQASRVIRYVLNNPNSNGYPMLEGADDLIVCFSNHYWPTPKPVLMLLIDEPFFNDHGTRPAAERQMDCSYVGKGVKFGHCFKVPGTVMLERVWPSDKEGLAVMLKNTRYFYTWDLVSQTNFDAVRCGAIPVVMRWHPFDRNILTTEIGELPYAEVVVENNTLILVHQQEQYEQKRTRFLDNYRQIANSNATRVAEFIQIMDKHFNKLE